jgi:hypothetical protein
MTYPRYIPEGGRQVPPPDGDPYVADVDEHRDVMGELIAEHQLERGRQHDLDEREHRIAEDQGDAEHRRPILQRLLHRRRPEA